MKLAQRQIIGSIAPAEVMGMATPPDFTGYFAQVSGGEITASVEKVFEGGKKFPETLCAPAEVGDVTLTRHYDPTRDGSLVAGLRGLVGAAYYDITIEETDCDLKVMDSENNRMFTQALVVGLTEPDGDASSGAPATFSITLAIGGLKEAGTASAGTAI
ncbi:MAG: hypothetical protein HOI21_00465 [Bacteroidetes Order II. Incertae sedis bacterium]|jgi:hypothetical protein|nr:hypothetical protein [Bacteroidetes Order II. bacterium]